MVAERGAAVRVVLELVTGAVVLEYKVHAKFTGSTIHCYQKYVSKALLKYELTRVILGPRTVLQCIITGFRILPTQP